MYLPHFYLSIHLSRDTSTLVTVNNAAANMGVPVICFKSLLAILLGPYPEMELLMKHIFVPLKGICCLCFGLQHLHQNQKKKSESVWKTAVNSAAKAGRAESASEVSKVPVKCDPGHKLGAAAETLHFLA